jgi:hypothetical protein
MNLEWHNTDPSTADALREQTIADLKHSMGDLKHPSQLVFHHIFLTEDYDGPCVFVWGEEGSEAFHCEYCEKTEWKTGEELDAEKTVLASDQNDAKI